MRRQRHRQLAAPSHCICLITQQGYIEVLLNRDALLLTGMGADRRQRWSRSFVVLDASQVFDGRGWNLALLMYLVDRFGQ